MESKTALKISVRNLVEFTLMSGDLSSGFSGSSRLVDGIRAHQEVQKSAGKSYTPEVTVSYLVENVDLSLEISGRIDGIIDDENGITVDEIKSTTEEPEYIHQDYNQMHWAQAMCYAFIYSAKNSLEGINVRLTYFNLDTKEMKQFQRTFSIEDLEVFFNDIIDKYFAWASVIKDWSITRDISIKELEFPFAAYRKGQRELAAAAYRTIRDGGKLFVQAPTGIGKTAATLFPAIKAICEGHTSKIFYLTAKTITRTIAEKAVDNMKEKGLRLKTLTITAKDKICFKPGSSCDPEQCEFSKGYYDRVKDAVGEIYMLDSFTRTVIEDYARKYCICPFEFSLDLSLWADCIIGDYNYVFDPRVYLKRFFQDGGGDYTFLIDETHNLVDRAREMYSAELFKKSVLELKRAVKSESKELSKKLDKINSCMIKFRKMCEAEGVEYLVLEEAPKELYPLLKKFIKFTEKWLVENESSPLHEGLLDFYFQVSGFIRTSEYFDDRYLTYFEKIEDDIRVKLFCIDPSILLNEAMKRGKAAVLFSATLSPMDYFSKILGGGDDSSTLRLSSPFPKDNLCLMVDDKISTRYKVREKSIDRVAKSISIFVSGRIGNYLVYFPSYKYMNEVLFSFIGMNREVRVISQRSGMTENDKEVFLNEFFEPKNQSLVGFAVMGGMFGEGIDLTGEQLLGAIIVGVGLPQICLEREIIRGYFQEQNEMGYEYAYMYPGMNKVMQAVGRVIRTENDRGAVLLIDERFSYPGYRELFPPEWEHAVRINGTKTLDIVLSEFWEIDNT